MTPRERVKTAISHRSPDICPYSLGFGGKLRERLVEFTGDESFDAALEPHIGGVRLAFPAGHTRLDETHYTDVYGVIWEESVPGEIGMVREPIIREPDLSGYEFPKVPAEGLFEGTEEQFEAGADRFLVWGIGFSLYERAWSLRGIEQFLMDMVVHPEFADELLDSICEFNLALIDQACTLPIDCVRFGDDWGSQRGLIMGPDLWRRFIKPRFARMVERAASHGKATFLHSDGDVVEVIPDLIEIGLTILNPVQPDVMDVYEVKRDYGRDISFHGGVSVQQFLPRSTADEVRAEVRRLIREVGDGGGFIIAPTHSLGWDIPLKNLVVLVEEFTDQAHQSAL